MPSLGISKSCLAPAEEGDGVIPKTFVQGAQSSPETEMSQSPSRVRR